MTDDQRGIRLHHLESVPAIGVPFDCGWAVGVFHPDNTLTRTCKGCGVSATSAVIAGPNEGVSEVVPAPIHHRDGCPVVAAMQIAAFFNRHKERA